MKNKTLDEAKKAMEATPEHKAYKEACKAKDEAWDAVCATPEYKADKEIIEAWKKAGMAYRETLKCEFYAKAWEAVWAYEKVNKALEATPEWKTYKEAENALDERKKALEKTPEFKDFLKAVKAEITPYISLHITKIVTFLIK